MMSLEQEIQDLESLGWLENMREFFTKMPEFARDYVEILENFYDRKYPNLHHYAQAQYIITRLIKNDL